MRRLYLISFVTLSAIAAACGGKGDDSGGGGGDGDITGDGDGDGDITGDGDGDITGDGDGDTSIGGAGGMGGGTGTGGDPGTGGELPIEEGCSGTATSCEAQTEDNCIAAGCSFTPGCSGEAGCEALDNAPDCNSQADNLDCTFGTICSGTPDECTDYSDGLSCEDVGCTWVEN